MDIRNRKGRLLAAIALLFPIAFTSCGGGGDFAGGGTGGTGIGPVTGFGSVKVNGVRYSTTGANIVIGGVENRPESELKVGMRVRVNGDFSAVDNTGTAGRIEVIREVRGPLDDNGVDNVLNRIRVAGQTVLVDPATVFDNVAGLPALQSLQAGTVRHPEVEVHGAADDVGFIHATYIRKGADDFPVASDDVEVRGKVSGLDPLAFRFLIGSLPVSFSAPGLVKVNWPLTGIANGQYVEAKGRITAAGGSGTLSASRIEVLDNAVGGNNDPVRVEGYVVSGASKDSFVLLGPGGQVTVNGVGATLSGGTVAPGVKVQVEGSVSGAILRASVVRVRPAGKVRIEAGVSGAPNVAAGTFTVLGKQIRTDGYTRFKDTSGGLRTFGLADLSSGDNVMVVGSYEASGDVVNAILVERISSLDNDRPLLQGPAADEIPDVSFTIVGIRVDAGFTNTEYFAKDGTSLGSGPTAVSAFFAELVEGDVVLVKRGVFSPGTPSTIDEGVGTPRMEIGFERVDD